MKKKIISLFDGISCGQYVISNLCNEYDYYSSEIEKDAIFITNKNFPKTRQLGDIKNINFVDGFLTNGVDHIEVGEVYLLQGGSPCQNFSFAGTAKGMTTEENVDVLNLDQYLDLKNKGFLFKGQSYLFWEYVRLLNEIKPKYFLLENVKMSKKWSDIISKAIGLDPILLNARYFGAQNRPRLFWTNIPFEFVNEDSNIFVKDILQNEKEIPSKFFLSDKAIDYMSRKRNSKPRWDYHTNPLNGKSACLTANMYKGVPYGVIKDLKRRLTPIECERLQNLPDNYTEGVSDSSRLKSIGNGWDCATINHIYKNIF